MSLRLLSYNIRAGGVGRIDAIAEVIRSQNADVVLLQEAIRPDLVERLAEQCGYPHHSSRSGNSTAFLSRERVGHVAWHRPRRARHAFLELVLADHDTRVFALHLSAWFSNWSERRRTIEIRALLEGIREHQHGFHLVVGDFNALAPGERLQIGRMPRWIRAMVWLSGNDIARATIQTMLDARYIDAWRYRNGNAEGYTFPTWDPHVRLDYAFAPERDAARIVECRIVGDPPAVKTASDHLPLLVDVDEPRAA